MTTFEKHLLLDLLSSVVHSVRRPIKPPLSSRLEAHSPNTPKIHARNCLLTRGRAMKYGGHDVSNQPRDEDGRWTTIGGAVGTTFTRRPSKSITITTENGRFVGEFDHATGWVRRAVHIGDGPAEMAVAHIDDVVKVLNRAKAPVTSADWNDWYIVNGHSKASASTNAPGYLALNDQTEADLLIPHGSLRAISGFDSEGRPRELSASMAGPAVIMLVTEIGRGLLEKHAGGKIIGVGVNAGGKFIVRIAKRGKVVVEELTESMAKKLRQRIDQNALKGTREGVQARKWLERSAPKIGWKSSNRWDTGENATLLRRNLGASIRPHEQAHHIVLSTHTKAGPARELLDKYQIDINDAVNGVPLPASGPKPAHHGHRLHAIASIERVNTRLDEAIRHTDDWATGRSNLLKELATLKIEIINGDFP